MKVLGVDPGSYVWGYGVVETGNGNGSPRFGRLVECGVFSLTRKSPLPQRLLEIHASITDLIARHHPTALALESSFYHKNVRTTLVLGQTRGVVLLAAQQAGLEIAEYPPATVKKTVVGAGGAQKRQVAEMVAQMLKLKTPPRPYDAADGVAVALTHIIRT